MYRVGRSVCKEVQAGTEGLQEVEKREGEEQESSVERRQVGYDLSQTNSLFRLIAWTGILPFCIVLASPRVTLQASLCARFLQQSDSEDDEKRTTITRALALKFR